MVDTDDRPGPFPCGNTFRRRLLRWYAIRHRPLPWRETSDPYAVWLSEIMLQQTQVDTALPYYRRFLERFPTVEALAAAPREEVLKLWENLGYYSRARHLHEAAVLIVERHGGQIPDRWDSLIRLPGIGRYTAGAILSIAYGLPLPAVDGNVRRVVSRLCALEEPLNDPAGARRIEALLAPLIPKRDPGLFNQALMELGALVCRPRDPACADCPLKALCRARAVGWTDRLPSRERRRAVPHREVVAAVLQGERKRLLIVRRPPAGLLGSLWKFPGGILDPGEPLAEGLRRLVRGELGVEIDVGPKIIAVKHAYTHLRITLTAFSCTFPDGRPAPRGRTWRWASLAELDRLPFSKADRLVARALHPD